ncbi:GGDEF domain-containing protein [Methylobacterium platani]|uniref:diguanylate cyclase n=1 Tax=Methylobacterium platani TaxID=427683 RepID=A0A179S3Q0_9HYPH|nr:sensor domain-containing diguanylate cyclase [Methylobacterium platani]OAS18484.1 hypothetical protein A5481_26350 [Methylobacterium platani]
MTQTMPPGGDLEAQLFDLAPTSLWLQDLGALKACLDGWRDAGMTDLRDHLRDPDRLLACQRLIRLVRVNRQTLATYEARDEAELFAHIPAIFNDPQAAAFIEVLCRLWAGATQVRLVTQNRTVPGRVIDVGYAGQLMPGHEADWGRYLISIEDITRREDARSVRAVDLFAYSPVPTLIRDEGRVAAMLADLREAGVADLAGHLAAHPGWVEAARASRPIVAANAPALALFGVPDREALAVHLAATTPGEAFVAELLDLWAGREQAGRDVVLPHRDGRDLHLKLHASRLPQPDGAGHLVQVALTDIGANKRTEARLTALSLSDHLTGLRNRAGLAAEIARIEDGRVVPTSVIVADLNGLKATNDRLGHEAGDALIRRFGVILAQAASGVAARTGGDEFVVLLPRTGPEEAAAVARRIQAVVDAPGPLPLSASLGVETWTGDGPLGGAIARADARMYAAKRRYHGATAEPRDAVVPSPRPH